MTRTVSLRSLSYEGHSFVIRRINWIHTVPFLLSWIPAAVAILYLKFISFDTYRQLVFKGWRMPFDWESWNVIDKLSIFRADILFCLLLIPLGLILLAALLPHRLRAPSFAAFSVFCIFVSYTEVKSLYLVGRPYSFSLLRDAIRWSWADPTSIRDNVNSGGLLRFFALILSVIALSWWPGKRSEGVVQNSSVQRRWLKSVQVGLLPLMAIVLLPWLSRRNAGPQDDSVLATAIRAFWGWGEEDEGVSKQFNKLGPRELIQRYQDIAHVHPSERDPRYWSAAAGADVLFFVFETGPAAMLPIDGNLDDFPNLRRLRERAFVAPSHYTTYPFTVRALFSCFSGWYPSDLTESSFDTYPDMITPGVIQDLSARGYHSAVYSPFPWSRAYDVKTAKAVGFEHISFGRESGQIVGISAARPWMVRESYDLEALRLLESDVDGWLSRGERFVVAFVPQLGHSPWSDISPDGHVRNVLERGRPLMAIQDAYLGRLLKLLESHQRLEKTLIVVTGDHRARTRGEDPELHVGMIDDISYHVPLLLYAPQVLQSSVTLPWVTSHIDLSPSVLDLLGIERERELEQGSPIWDAHLQDRTTFFFGRHYFWADGYYSRGQFFMWNKFAGSAYQSKHQHFTSSDGIPGNSAAYNDVTRTIQQMVGLQTRWLTVFGQHRDRLQPSTAGTK